jgi:hypothetical protein
MYGRTVVYSYRVRPHPMIENQFDYQITIIPNPGRIL